MVDSDPTPLLSRPRGSPGRWVCGDCHECPGFMFMVHDELWLRHCRKGEILCVGCFEKRMGRPLRLDDLKPCGVTDEYHFAVGMFKRENGL